MHAWEGLGVGRLWLDMPRGDLSTGTYVMSGVCVSNPTSPQPHILAPRNTPEPKWQAQGEGPRAARRASSGRRGPHGPSKHEVEFFVSLHSI